MASARGRMRPHTAGPARGNFSGAPVIRAPVSSQLGRRMEMMGGGNQLLESNILSNGNSSTRGVNNFNNSSPAGPRQSLHAEASLPQNSSSAGPYNLPGYSFPLETPKSEYSSSAGFYSGAQNGVHFGAGVVGGGTPPGSPGVSSAALQNYYGGNSASSEVVNSGGGGSAWGGNNVNNKLNLPPPPAAGRRSLARPQTAGSVNRSATSSSRPRAQTQGQLISSGAAVPGAECRSTTAGASEYKTTPTEMTAETAAASGAGGVLDRAEVIAAAAADLGQQSSSSRRPHSAGHMGYSSRGVDEVLLCFSPFT